MDHITSNYDRKLTSQEILALIKARKDKPSLGEMDYFESKIAKHNVLQESDTKNVRADATALNINPHAGDADKGAILLNNKDEIKNLKAVAPLAQPTTASSSDDNITGENKLLAPAVAEPTNKAVAGSLCSPNDDKEVNDTCGADDYPLTAISDEPAKTAGEEVCPEFFKIRADLFDNGEVRNKTRYTAKLTIQVHQDDDPADNGEAFANFYSRSRDFRAFVKKKECWDQWYEDVLEVYEETCAMELDFKLKPIIAILKERDPDTRTFVPIFHTACISYQVHGGPAIILIAYEMWCEKFALNAQFQAKSRNAPIGIGYYVDPARAGLEAQKETPPMRIKKPGDFRKSRS